MRDAPAFPPEMPGIPGTSPTRFTHLLAVWSCAGHHPSHTKWGRVARASEAQRRAGWGTRVASHLHGGPHPSRCFAASHPPPLRVGGISAQSPLLHLHRWRCVNVVGTSPGTSGLPRQRKLWANARNRGNMAPVIKDEGMRGVARSRGKAISPPRNLHVSVALTLELKPAPILIRIQLHMGATRNARYH